MSSSSATPGGEDQDEVREERIKTPGGNDFFLPHQTPSASDKTQIVNRIPHQVRPFPTRSVRFALTQALTNAAQYASELKKPESAKKTNRLMLSDLACFVPPMYVCTIFSMREDAEVPIE